MFYRWGAWDRYWIRDLTRMTGMNKRGRTQSWEHPRGAQIAARLRKVGTASGVDTEVGKLRETCIAMVINVARTRMLVEVDHDELCVNKFTQTALRHSVPQSIDQTDLLSLLPSTAQYANVPLFSVLPRQGAGHQDYQDPSKSRPSTSCQPNQCSAAVFSPSRGLYPMELTTTKSRSRCVRTPLMNIL
jgi:hypothetical protein